MSGEYSSFWDVYKAAGLEAADEWERKNNAKKIEEFKNCYGRMSFRKAASLDHAGLLENPVLTEHGWYVPTKPSEREFAANKSIEVFVKRKNYSGDRNPTTKPPKWNREGSFGFDDFPLNLDISREEWSQVLLYNDADANWGA